jgi:hypothetical protein
MSEEAPFNPSESGYYKILSALDQSKCFTVQQSAANPLVIDHYKGANNQKFNIYDNKGKYALVCAEGNVALWVTNESNQDGAAIQADSNQHKSTYFEIQPVKTGHLVGLGFYIKSFSGKSLDVFEGRTEPGTRVIQWSFHGNTNQIWLIVPADDQAVQINTSVAANLNVFAEVPVSLVPANTPYKILSVLNTTKALTVSNTKERELKISDYVSDPSQKFNLYPNGNKLAFVVQSFNEGLCVFKDSQELGGQIKSDAGQHSSSWFEVVRVTAGPWANKAYKIKTHSAQKVLDIAEGSTENGTRVLQFSEHGNDNQIWLIVPTDQAVQKYESKSSGKTQSIFGINLPHINLPNLNLPNLNLPNMNIPKFG